MSLTLVRHKLSVDQYEQMIRTGILTEDDPVELLRGELVEKMPTGDAHVDAVNRLNQLLSKRLEEPAVVSVQNPVVLTDSQPEPDVAVVLYHSARRGKPHARDLKLVIEVADSSLEIDRTLKLQLYAEAGIPEYWIVNLLDEQIEVYREPQVDGTYREMRIYAQGQQVEPIAFAGVTIPVANLLA